MAKRNSSKSSFNSLVKQPYFFAAIILIAVVAVVLMFSAGSGQTAKFSAAAISSCTDSDGGWNKDITGTCKDNKGAYTDSCTGGGDRGYFEYFCSAGVCKKSSKLCPQDQVCQNGACISKPAPPPKQQCTDTDGGKDDSVKGTVTTTNGSVVTDYCGTQKYLQEAYCDGSDVKVIAIDCAAAGKICSNGACIATPACTDTDGGEVYDKKGTCTFWNATSQKQESRTDECGPAGYNYVTEYFCSNNACTSNYKNGACSDGALGSCTESWSCTNWGTCSQSGAQNRTCTDANNCGTTSNKPITNQSCTPPAMAPVLFVDVPTANQKFANNTVVTFYGWAYDANYKGTTTIGVFVDGNEILSKRNVRADVCNAYPKAHECTAVGGNTQLVGWDANWTTSADAGGHTFKVIAKEGGGTTIEKQVNIQVG